MQEETRVRYGLRHPSGKFVRLEITSNRGQEFCGEETCEMTVDDWRSDGPRYEVDTLYDLLAACVRDVSWFNSSRERPMWGNIVPAECKPYRFERTLVWDRLGGDPVKVTDSREFALPRFFKGTAFPTYPKRKQIPDFGIPVEDIDLHFLCIAKLEGNELEPGMLLFNEITGIGLVAAHIPVPKDWPIEPGRPFDKNDPDYRLVFVRFDVLKEDLWTERTTGTEGQA